MAQAQAVQASFTAGELDPTVESRFDLPQYHQGCRQLENCGILPQGGVARRPGSIYVQNGRSNSVKCRLISYERTGEDLYILELGNGFVRFYKNSAYLSYELAMPWADADLFDLRTASYQNTIWFVHPSYDPRLLTWTTDTDWAFSTPHFYFSDAGPTGIEGIVQANPGVVTTDSAHGLSNSDAVLIYQVKGMTQVNNQVFTILNVTSDTFTLHKLGTTTAVHTGLYDAYRLGGVVVKTDSRFDAANTRPKDVTFYEGRLVFAFPTDKLDEIYGSRTVDGDGTSRHQDFSQNNPNTSAVVGSHAYQFSVAVDQGVSGSWIVSSTALVLGTTGSEVILQGAGGGPLTPLSAGAKEQSGYGSKFIRPIKTHNRIIFVQKGGRTLRELSPSSVGDRVQYVAPSLNVLARHITDSGVALLSKSDEPHSVVYAIREDGKVAVLTYDPESGIKAWGLWELGGTNAVVESMAVIPTAAGEDQVWLSVKRTIAGVDVRHIEYLKPWDWGADDTDMWFLDAAEITDKGAAAAITGISTATEAVVTAAAHGFANNDKVRIRNIGAMVEVEDKVFTVANQDTNTFKIRDETDNWYINSSSYGTAAGSGGTATRVVKTITGLNHLEGETVKALADGAISPVAAVVSGASNYQVTLDDYYNKVVVGVPYTSKVKPMSLYAGGLTRNRIRIHMLVAMFRKTGSGVEYGSGTNNLTEIEFEKYGEKTLGSQATLFTGSVPLSFPAEVDDAGNADVYFQQDEPLPMTLLMVRSEFDVERK